MKNYRWLMEKFVENENIRGSYNEENGLTTYKYVNMGVDFTDEAMRLARGFTMDNEGNAVLVGYEKFFNEGQFDDRDDLDPAFKEQFTKMQIENEDQRFVFREKLDGTMILVGTYKGQLVFGTTGSTRTEYSTNAARWFQEKGITELLKRFLGDSDYTMIFEYVGPDNTIVVKYDEPRYVLLDIVVNSNLKRFEPSLLKRIARQFNLETPKVFELTMAELSEKLEDEGIEGFVTENSYGKLLKFKTQQWFDLHGYYELFGNDRLTRRFVETVMDSLLDETEDDVVAQINRLGNKGVLANFKAIKQAKEDFAAQVEKEAERARGKTNKEIALDETIDPRIKGFLYGGKDEEKAKRLLKRVIVEQFKE